MHVDIFCVDCLSRGDLWLLNEWKANKCLVKPLTWLITVCLHAGQVSTQQMAVQHVALQLYSVQCVSMTLWKKEKQENQCHLLHKSFT